MSKESRSIRIKEIKAEYHKNLRELESKLASKHSELAKVEQSIKHEAKKIYDSKLSDLKTKKIEINASILRLKKEIKNLRKEETKKLKKL